MEPNNRSRYYGLDRYWCAPNSLSETCYRSIFEQIANKQIEPSYLNRLSKNDKYPISKILRDDYVPSIISSKENSVFRTLPPGYNLRELHESYLNDAFEFHPNESWDPDTGHSVGINHNGLYSLRGMPPGLERDDKINSLTEQIIREMNFFPAAADAQYIEIAEAVDIRYPANSIFIPPSDIDGGLEVCKEISKRLKKPVDYIVSRNDNFSNESTFVEHFKRVNNIISNSYIDKNKERTYDEYFVKRPSRYLIGSEYVDGIGEFSII